MKEMKRALMLLVVVALVALPLAALGSSEDKTCPKDGGWLNDHLSDSAAVVDEDFGVITMSGSDGSESIALTVNAGFEVEICVKQGNVNNGAPVFHGPYSEGSHDVWQGDLSHWSYRVKSVSTPPSTTPSTTPSTVVTTTVSDEVTTTVSDEVTTTVSDEVTTTVSEEPTTTVALQEVSVTVGGECEAGRILSDPDVLTASDYTIDGVPTANPSGPGTWAANVSVPKGYVFASSDLLSQIETITSEKSKVGQVAVILFEVEACEEATTVSTLPFTGPFGDVGLLASIAGVLLLGGATVLWAGRGDES